MDDDPAAAARAPIIQLPPRWNAPAQAGSDQPEGEEHKPLKYLPLSPGMIRLIRVNRELSPDGLIQCNLEHSTVDDEYRCLSYVWGPPGGEKQININGQIARVRSNLHDFLNIARAKYPFLPLWIDALCIDQENVIERNHQVQEMGNIYSQARMVIAWLGDNQELASGLKALRNKLTPSPVIPFPKDFYKNKKYWEDYPLLTSHEYWTRAWIVQEILLARSVVLLASNARLNISLFPEGWYSTYDHIGPLLSPKSDDIKPNLLSQLNQFRDKGCALLHDRIYSLLSLCGTTKHIEVDYTIPTWSLGIRVLQSSGSRVCLCAMLTLLRALDIHHEDIPEFNLKSGKLEEQPVFDLTTESKFSMFGAKCTHGGGGHTLHLHSLCDRFFVILMHESEGEGCSLQHLGKNRLASTERIKSANGITVAQDPQTQFCHWRFSFRAIAEILEFTMEQKWAEPIAIANDGNQNCSRVNSPRGKLSLYWPQPGFDFDSFNTYVPDPK